MKKSSFSRFSALSVAIFGTLVLGLGAAYALTWPETPAGEVDGGKIGHILHPNSTSDKLGLGTFDPLGRFNVVGTSGVKELTGPSTNGTGADCPVGQERVPVDTSGLQVGFLLGGEAIVSVGSNFVCLLTNSMAWAQEDAKEWKDPTTDVVIDAQGKMGIKTSTPQQALDVSGAINLGNTASNTLGAVRFNETTNDFEGYTGSEWASLTLGNGGCEALTDDDGSGGFVTGTVSVSCPVNKSISHAAMEWETSPNIYVDYLGIRYSAANDAVNADCMGHGCKLQVICCEGANGVIDTLSSTVCADGETLKWNDASADWICSADNNTDIWSQNATDIYYSAGKVGIGTMTPNAQLHIKTNAGLGNAEIDIQSGDQPHWALYHDEATRDLRFWNDDNRMTITSGGNVGVGTTSPTTKLEVMGNIIAANPTNNNHVATKEYVDESVAAAGTVELYGKTCPEGTVQSGYNADGSINCNTITGGTSGGDVELSFDGGVNDGAGNYFSVGGADHFCLKYTVDSSGMSSFTEINDGLRCSLDNTKSCWDAKCLENDRGQDNYCRNYDFLGGTYTATHELGICGADGYFCSNGNCVGGECTVPDGNGWYSVIDYQGEQWGACTELDCHYASTGKIREHVLQDGSDPDDICRQPIYATTVNATTGDLGGHAWSADVGYISFEGTDYGVSLPTGLGSGDVMGYAWSPEVGYINFCNSGAGYCVQFDSTTDQLSGYAWSSEVGYIKFDGSDVNGDSIIDYGVYVDRNVNRVQGSAWNPEIGYIRFTEEESSEY